LEAEKFSFMALTENISISDCLARIHQTTISFAVVDSSGKLIMECILETKSATILVIAANTVPDAACGLTTAKSCSRHGCHL
jgi:hypothetical protein